MTPEGLLINWYESEQMEVGVDLEYTDSKGSIKKVFMPDSINQILLDDCDVATPFTYVTRYKPVKEAIDEFYAAKEQGIVEFPSELTLEIQMDNGPFWSCYTVRLHAAPRKTSRSRWKTTSIMTMYLRTKKTANWVFWPVTCWETADDDNDGFGLTVYNFYDDYLKYYNMGLANNMDIDGINSDNKLSTLGMIS